MSGALFDQYKAALRRGHVAALAGKLDEALEAYRDAARLVPERALPLASQATVLHRLNQWDAAVEAFAQALRLAPEDEATLRARGTAFEERGLRADAAADQERLALVLDAAGRAADAVDAARHADELAGSSARTALLARLVEALANPPVAPPRPAEPAEPAPATIDGETATAPRRVPETAAEAARAANLVDPAAEWPPLDLPSQPPALVGPPPDPETLVTNAMTLLDARELSAARDLMLSAVLIHRQAGQLDAALDVCLQLLEIEPGDPQVHLAIANLQLDHGWLAVATEKVELLRELTALTGDAQATADVQYLAIERLREAPVPSAAATPAAAR